MKPAGPPVLHGEAEGGERRTGWGPPGGSAGAVAGGTPALSCPQPTGRTPRGHANLPRVGQRSLRAQRGSAARQPLNLRPPGAPPPRRAKGPRALNQAQQQGNK